ncbi:unnamed protein product [Lasius platythorax]|uniref:Uncharacterized protein n=1 Tax=Lasius platythorax TaxID=488582 RepID=A0AAV2P3C4_9HYME
MRVSQPSIIISHAVVRECIPGCGRGPTETSVDSMLFPLITFIIGFKMHQSMKWFNEMHSRFFRGAMKSPIEG